MNQTVIPLFHKAVEMLLEIEGGFVNHALDRGGATNFGITEALARECKYLGAMCDLPLDQAKEIYASRFWIPLKLNEIGRQSEQIAVEIFEIAVNCGVGTAAKILQEALNLLNSQGKDYPDVTVDGVLGTLTIEAFQACRDKKRLLKLLNVLQGAKYVMICKADPKQEVFLRGWLKRVTLRE